MRELATYIEEATRLAGTDIEKQRVKTWKTGVWDYMKAGYDSFHAKAEAETAHLTKVNESGSR